MTSQLDLDQGGTNRQWTLTWMGPSIGYAWRPVQNVLAITAAGTYTIDPSTNYVTVAVAASVTLTLPLARYPTNLMIVQPALYQENQIFISDIGGNANSFPITIVPSAENPPSPLETIGGLSSIQLNVNFGTRVLQPSRAQHGWDVII